MSAKDEVKKAFHKIESESGWKLYQVVNEQGKKSYMIIHTDETDFPEHYLEYDEEIETDCWLADVLGCDNSDITVVKN